jgi:hypothetical protein
MKEQKADPGYLDIVTTQELIDEIFRRHDAAVVVVETEARNQPDKVEYEAQWKGSHSYARGLLHRAIDDVRQTRPR